MKTLTLTLSRLREVLAYDPGTGLFTWVSRSSSRSPAGNTAGCLAPNGYVQIRIDGVLYQAHRLAWFYVTGEWPTSLLDHIDLNRANNRWTNLRTASPSQNSANSPMRRHNSTGFKGVTLNRKVGKYRARITVEHREHHLGFFDTASQAYEAYRNASLKFHGEFGRAS
ncbi:hypothetical protein CAL14_08440 [Bordetella genomosp. 9]|uniref:HNH endonuclease n=1 Tax=Bordetella genomosp. 9 TaxID=1416803 RepID=UPI000A28F306|nr:HNH endonuclease [Bordetella genomosp. 9]ARP90310.1 hypothetical protein CAL14_08440 [Bordetella genomosp. 9]